VKQIIVLRKDLSMDVGKLISQACHACLEASEAAKKKDHAIWKAWKYQGAKKIVVKVFSLSELLELQNQAKRLGVPHALIVDRGLTQLPPNTPTALGIGPWKAETIDKITGELKLF
jgi:PTH2 family peptidyl-tRNA hydrolase